MDTRATYTSHLWRFHAILCLCGASCAIRPGQRAGALCELSLLGADGPEVGDLGQLGIIGYGLERFACVFLAAGLQVGPAQQNLCVIGILDSLLNAPLDGGYSLRVLAI